MRISDKVPYHDKQTSFDRHTQILLLSTQSSIGVLFKLCLFLSVYFGADSMKTVVVLGGGIGGLAASYYLSKSPQIAKVIHRDTQCYGGKSFLMVICLLWTLDSVILYCVVIVSSPSGSHCMNILMF